MKLELLNFTEEEKANLSEAMEKTTMYQLLLIHIEFLKIKIVFIDELRRIKFLRKGLSADSTFKKLWRLSDIKDNAWKLIDYK